MNKPMTFMGIPIVPDTDVPDDTIYIAQVPPGKRVVQRQTGAQWHELEVDPKGSAKIVRKLKPGQRIQGKRTT